MQLQAVGIIFPCNRPLAIEIIPEAKGLIAAIFIFARLILTAIGLQVVSYFYKGNFTSLGIAMSLSLLISFWSCYKIANKDKIFE